MRTQVTIQDEHNPSLQGGFGPTPPDTEDKVLVSFTDFSQGWLRRSLAIGAALGIVVGGAPFALPDKYPAKTTFVVESGSSQKLSGLALLASEFGVGQALESSRSPRFYLAALKSRAIADTVLGSRFRTSDDVRDTTTATLQEILVPSWTGSIRDRERAVKRLYGMTAISLDPQTAIVSVEVRSKRQGMSADVANAFVSALDRFNREYRQSNGKRRRVFLEQRVIASRAELTEAEDALRQFLAHNRDYQTSPQLSMVHQRLSRDVMSKQEIYTGLLKQYETARIDEVDDQPTISIIDQARPPALPSLRRQAVVALARFGAAVLLVLAASVVNRLFNVGGTIRMWIRELNRVPA